MKKIICMVLMLLVSYVAVANLSVTKVTLHKNSQIHKFFTEPIEILYFITHDFIPHRLTSNDERQVVFYTDRLREDLKKEGYEIKDLIMVIHNHLKLGRISEKDKRFYRWLLANGFHGVFAIYLQGTNTVLIYEEK